jgi:hypothetical protein
MSWLDSFFSKGYQVIQAAGVALPSESILNFTNSSVVTDDPTTGSTNVAFTLLTAPTGTGLIHVVSGVIQNPAEAVGLTTDVTGVLPIANGGTGLNSVGTSGYVLTSTGSAMSWQSAPSGITQLTGDVTAGPGAGSQVATVTHVHGTSVPAGGSLTTGNVLQVNLPSGMIYGPINLAGGSNYVTGVLPDANLPTPSGDWTGTIDSNTVTHINGTSVPAGGSLTVGNGLHVINSSALSYGALNLAGGSGYVTGVLPITNLPNLAGDVTGTITSNTVVKLQGVAVSSSSPTNGQALVYTNSSTHWIATSAAGDLTGSTFLASYVGTISGVGGAGGTVTVNAGALEWAAGQTPTINQASVSVGIGANMTIAAQTSTGSSGGSLQLQSGAGSTALNAGVIDFFVGTELAFQMAVDSNGNYAFATPSLSASQGSGVFRTANNVTVLSCSALAGDSGIALIGTMGDTIVIGDTVSAENMSHKLILSSNTWGYQWYFSTTQTMNMTLGLGAAFNFRVGADITASSMFEVFTNAGGSGHRVLALCQLGGGLSGSNAPTGDGVVWLGNATTNPSSDPTGGGILYASAGALYWLGSSGTSTKIANA